MWLRILRDGTVEETEYPEVVSYDSITEGEVMKVFGAYEANGDNTWATIINGLNGVVFFYTEDGQEAAKHIYDAVEVLLYENIPEHLIDQYNHGKVISVPVWIGMVKDGKCHHSETHTTYQCRAPIGDIS